MTTRARPRTRPRGFTLIEVTAAAAVFAIIAAGVATGSVAVTRYNRGTRSLSVAAVLAQDTIEHLRALDPESNPAFLSAGLHVDPNSPLTATGATGGRFGREWTVTRDTPAPGLATVVVTVSWTDGGSRSLRLTTLLCQTTGCM